MLSHNALSAGGKCAASDMLQPCRNSHLLCTSQGHTWVAADWQIFTVYPLMADAQALQVSRSLLCSALCFHATAFMPCKSAAYQKLSADGQLAEAYLCSLQDQFLQLLDGVSKLFSSPQGLSAAIYTQVSDVEAEVNGEL